MPPGVRIQAPCDIDEVLGALNGSGPFGRRQRYWEMWNSPAARHLPSQERPPHVPHPAPPEAYRQADLRTRELLGTYVDEWINSGRTSDGSERTGIRSRQLPEDGAALRAEEDYFRKVSGELYPTRKGIYTTLAWPISSPIGSEGEIDDPIKAADFEAARLMVSLMADDSVSSVIAKCRYLKCGKYFRAQKADFTYRRGTYCSQEHQRSALARELSDRARRESDQQLIAYAGTQLMNLLGKGSKFPAIADEKLKDDLKKRVNGYINEHSKQHQRRWQGGGVRKNWVTHNWRLIVKAARNRRAARGAVETS
jgi:hypothetical protein